MRLLRHDRWGFGPWRFSFLGLPNCPFFQYVLLISVHSLLSTFISVHSQGPSAQLAQTATSSPHTAHSATEAVTAAKLGRSTATGYSIIVNVITFGKANGM